ncbi:MAG: aminotransferase class I/II-fold pyridoxal phosphate-dependent enzyme [Pseudomonadota bacterium]|nr:aminotransferase class I/II-fold pyridoxal phosphate-dependent enzyme [Pseudomonadota bacterium]
MHNPRLDLLTDYPFQRLRDLLGDSPPGAPALNMALGEPQNGAPPLLAEALARHADGFGRYPAVNGTAGQRRAIAEWLERRYGLGAGGIDPEREVIPLNGTREGLFNLAAVAVPESKAGGRPLVVTPNPFYQCYLGAATMAGADIVLLPATAATGFLPDLESVDAATWDRTALMYLCTPGNPQGAIADTAYLARALELARRHDFVLALDECYAEIWDEAPPPGGLQVAAGTTERYRNLAVFHSLSKRSSAPGLRSGFMAGDANLVARIAKLRSFGGAPQPEPVCHASEALWRDEVHVEANRALYRSLFDIADEVFGNRPGYRRPAGGFFLWIDVGNGEDFARRAWTEAGVRILPGAYLARDGADGSNPGTPYVRVALVQDPETTRAALTRLAALMEASP